MMNILIANKGLLRKLWGIAWAVCISLVISSCGSSSTQTNVGEGLRPSPTDANGSSQAGLSSDVSNCASPPANSVYLCRNEAQSSGDIIAVDVRLNSDSPVFGAAFDLTLDPAVVKVAKKEDQSIDFSPPELPLAQEDPPIWKYLFVTLKEGQEDTLIIGTSRGRGIKPLSGSIPLVTLKFKTLTGKTPLSFSNNRVLDPAGQPIELFNDQWYGGHLAP